MTEPQQYAAGAPHVFAPNLAALMAFACTLTVAAFAIAEPVADTPVSNMETQPEGPVRQQGVAGTVTDSRGVPVRDILIEAMPLSPDAGPVPDLAVMTDQDGIFFWDLEPGHYALKAHVPSGTPLSTDVIVQRNQVTRIKLQAP
jgi:protocatechuate 3,4-dioxygenase beta subunit